MELKCKFDYQEWCVERADVLTQLYTCTVTTADIDKPDTIVRAFIGTHLAGKCHKDVEALQFIHCEMKHLPRGAQDIFPHLRGLEASYCRGLTTLTRSDLVGLQSLEALYMNDNKLKSLPSTLFVGMSNLKIIDFRSNQIESMSSDLLKQMKNNGLAWVDFKSNGNLNALFCPKVGNVASIEELMEIIDERCTKPEDDAMTSPASTIALGGLLDSMKFADFTVTAGSKKFLVHKVILASQSLKFAEMFEEANEMSIIDFNEIEVEAFLRYFYTGDVPVDLNVFQLFKISSKLDVAALKTHCEGKILSNLEDSNAFEIFKLGHDYSQKNLKEKAFEKIRKMFPDVEMPDSLMERPDKLKILIDAQVFLDSIKEEIRKM